MIQGAYVEPGDSRTILLRAEMPAACAATASGGSALSGYDGVMITNATPDATRCDTMTKCLTTLRAGLDREGSVSYGRWPG